MISKVPAYLKQFVVVSIRDREMVTGTRLQFLFVSLDTAIDRRDDVKHRIIRS
jgi:hypothetical protein